MRGLKTLVSTTALLAGLALAPAAHAQISINIGVQPVCSYGYYGYAPYACAPMGYYGSGYFYNGIFLGMGPWAGWGYGHGWGGHRFNGRWWRALPRWCRARSLQRTIGRRRRPHKPWRFQCRRTAPECRSSCIARFGTARCSKSRRFA